MRILHLANNHTFDNCDEQAIAFAFRKLGHEVIEVHEKRKHRTTNLESVEADICLFHKHPVVSEIAQLSEKMPCFFWFWDLVDSDDPTLKARCISRINWLKQILPYCKLGFLSDGDWVASNTTGKLRWLMQGADERVVGFGKRQYHEPFNLPILFMGMVNHGQKRASHVQHLKEKWGNQFHVLGDGGPRYRLHGRQLADYLASVKIVIAPDGPNTDRYWSNRVYLTLGFGGFLLHPYCEGLRQHYSPEELLMYKSRDHCDSLISMRLGDGPFLQEERKRIAESGYKATIERNLYRHRCAQLIEEVKKVL